MISRYEIFCKVMENGSFTKTAEELGYSQSAVSQAVRTLEQETETVLIDRKKDGIGLTADGEQYLPYFQQIYQAEKNLERKEEEMKGLTNSAIRIGTFTSVSRTFLPRLMMEFKKQYPEVRFILQQGEYTSIAQWVRDGSVDFGFANAEAVPGLETSSHTRFRPAPQRSFAALSIRPAFAAACAEQPDATTMISLAMSFFISSI